MTKGLFRNGLIIGYGVVFSQAMNVVAYPIIARLYNPSDLGVYSIFYFGALVLGGALAGRYEQGIILAKNQFRARAVMHLAHIVSFLLTFVLMITSFLFRNALDRAIGVDLDLYWPVLILCGLFLSYVSAFSIYSIRIGLYNSVSLNRASKAFFLFGFQAVLPFIFSANMGFLIAGEMLSTVLGFFALICSARFSILRRPSCMFGKRYCIYLFGLAKMYIDQPKWNLPHVLIGNSSRWLLMMTITAFYSTAQAGAFFVMFRVLMMPATLISNSLSQVYFKEASEEQRRSGVFKGTILRLLFILSVVGSSFALVMIFFGPELFSLALGDEWRESGAMAGIFAPWLVFQLILSTLAPSYLLGGQQKMMLFVSTLQTLCFIGGFAAGHLIFGTLNGAITLCVWFSVPYMFLMLLWYLRLAAKPTGEAYV